MLPVVSNTSAIKNGWCLEVGNTVLKSTVKWKKIGAAQLEVVT